MYQWCPKPEKTELEAMETLFFLGMIPGMIGLVVVGILMVL